LSVQEPTATLALIRLGRWMNTCLEKRRRPRMTDSVASMGNARLVSREDAIKAGLKTYFTGKPCVHGHLAYRRTYDHKCAECNRLKMKKWRKDTPDYEVDRYKSDAEYRANKISRASLYYEKNKDQVNERKKV